MLRNPDAQLEIVPGRQAKRDTLDRDTVITWPTDLDEKTVVRTLIASLQANKQTAGWRHEVLANDELLSTQAYLESAEIFIGNDTGLVRFNAGTIIGGFSVTAVINDGNPELEGVFGPGDESLASRIVLATIIDPGKDRIDEIVGLAQAS